MVLLISAVFYPEPVVSSMISKDLAEELSKDNDVVVLSPYPTRPFGKVYTSAESIKINSNFKHELIESYTCPESNIFGRFKESYSFGKETAKYIEKNYQSIDVIYANTWPLFAQKFIADIAYKFNIPLVLHIQDIYPESLTKKLPYIGSLINKIIIPFDKSIISKTTIVITISNKMKEYLEQTRNINKDKITLIRNWQNDELFLKQKDIKNTQLKEKKDFIFMYAGSISPSANVDLLIKSFVLANIKNSSLVIAGNGTDKQRCIDLATKLCNNKITFLEVDTTQVPTLQLSADVLLLPLKIGVGKTALPSKLTAYMLSGKPVLASIDSDSEVSEIINNQKCGKISLPEDMEDLKNKMIEFTKYDKNTLNLMGKNSLEYAKNNLSKKENLQKMKETILKTVKKKGKVC